MQNISEEDGVTVVMTLQTNGASTDRGSREVLPEPFPGEGGDGFVLLKRGSVMEDMTICARVVVTGVIFGEVGIENGKSSLHDTVVSSVPRMAAGVRYQR